MKRILSDKRALLLSRFLIGTVFIVASIDKIASPAVFAASVEAYRMLPLWSVNFLALVIPWLELICGILLLTGVYLRGSSVIMAAFLVIFIAAISSAILRHLTIDCGCFGSGVSSPVSWLRVAEDAGLLLLTFHVLAFSSPVREATGVSRARVDDPAGPFR